MGWQNLQYFLRPAQRWPDLLARTLEAALSLGRFVPRGCHSGTAPAQPGTTRNQTATHDVLTRVIFGARFTFLAIVTGLVVACGSQHPAADPPASLVTGKVAAGPVTPLARPGVPATRAVPGMTVEALRGTQVTATAHTDEAGRYELRLQPGTYLIRAQSDKYLSREASKTVTLSEGQKLTVNLDFDTGIR